MSAQPTQAIYPHDPGPQAADAHTHRQVLNDLITLGASLARLLHAQATAQAAHQPQAAPPHPAQAHTEAQPAPPPAPAAPTLITIAATFDQVARAVRRCVALARSLDAPPNPAQDPARRRAAARRRIIREVEDAIHRAAHEGDRAESLQAELHDCLDAPDLDDDLAARPIAEVVTEIRRDLGIAGPPGDVTWKRRTPADLAQLSARAAAPSTARLRAPHQPGAAQHPRPGAAQHPPPGPLAAPAPATPIPAPAHGSNVPDDHAAVALIPRHPAHWHPPPWA